MTRGAPVSGSDAPHPAPLSEGEGVFRRIIQVYKTYTSMHCESLYITISPDRIGLLRFLLEGYDGMAMLSTLDSKSGLVRLLFPGPRYNEVMAFLSAVANDLRKC